MKNFFFIKIKLPIELPPSRPAPSPHAPEKIIYGKPEVVAASSIQVNDQFLTVDDVLSSARVPMLRLPRRIKQDTFRREAARILRDEIRRRVVESLVHAEAEKRLTDQQKKMIEDDLRETLATMIAEVGGSRKKLESLLAERGTDLATALDEERRRMMVRGFLQFRFYPAITVNRRMLWNYYRKHLSEFSFPKRVQMQIIARRYPKVAGGRVGPTRAERRLAAARARLVIHHAVEALRSGEEFAEAARRFSNGIKAAGGGVWPMMATGNFRETAVEQAAFAMDEGQVSSVIETETGYYIVKALKVRPGRTIRFEDAQEQVERQLREEQFAKLQEDYFRRLTEGAHIRQSEEFLKLAVDRAVKQYWRE